MSADMFLETYAKDESLSIAEQITDSRCVSSTMLKRGAWHIYHWMKDEVKVMVGDERFILNGRDLYNFLIDCHTVQRIPEKNETFFPGHGKIQKEDPDYFDSIDELVTICSRLTRNLDFNEYHLVFRVKL